MTFSIALVLGACAPVVAVILLPLATSVVTGVSAVDRAMKPPEKIYPVGGARGNMRIVGLVYADDARVTYWCSDFPEWRSAHAELCNQDR